MKLLHTSDWHLGKYLYDFSLQDDQEFMIEQLLRLLEAHRVEAILLAGDIFDRPVPPIWALQLFDHFLSQATQRLEIPVLAGAGNHDSGARLEFGSSLYRSGGYHICGYLEEKPRTVELTDQWGPLRVTLLPYLHPADVRALGLESPEEIKTYEQAYRTLLHSYHPDPDMRNIIVAHGFFSNLSGQAERKELLTSDSEINVGGLDLADSHCFAAYDYAALGHLHAPQWVEEGRVRYSGSPLKYSLSEQWQGKSFTLVEMNAKGSCSCEALPCPSLRDVRTIQGRFEDLLEPAFHKVPKFDDYVFAEIIGAEVPYPMEKLRTLFPNLLGLRFSASVSGGRPDGLPTGNRGPRLSTEELFCRFYEEMKGESLSQRQLALLRDTLEEVEGTQ